MLYLDVYNILHVTGVLPGDLAGIDLAGLLRLIDTSRYSQHELVAVVDGVRPVTFHAPLVRTSQSARVLFSGDASDADGLIEKLLAATPRSKKPIVVSSDHRLRRAAGKAHARHLRSEVFLHHLAIDHARHERGESPQSRREQQARPAFATDIPLDHLSKLKWINDLAATEAEKKALADAEQMSQQLAERLIERAPSQRIEIPAPKRTSNPAPADRKSSTKKPSGSRPPIIPQTAKATASPATADRAWLLAAGLTEADLDMNLWLKNGPSADTHRKA